MKNCVIIGGGLGGLVCGALLAKEGCSVTVLEKNNYAGGGLRCFHRHGVNYPTGMHFSGGFQVGGQLYKLCHFLGIIDQLRFVNLDIDSYDEVVSLYQNKHFCLPKGRNAYTESLCKAFPNNAKEIQNYIYAIYRLVDEVYLSWSRPVSRTFMDHSKDFFLAADRFIAHYITNPELRELFCYLIPVYAGVANETPAFIHALVNYSHIEGSLQFEDGSQQLADILVHLIDSYGGRVICGEEVSSFSVVERRVNSVYTKKGNTYAADDYISAVPVTKLITMSPQGAFPRSFCTRLMDSRCTYSAFKVYVRLKDGSVPYIHSNTFCSKGRGTAWHQFDGGESAWPQLMVFVAHPDKQCCYTRAITIISPMLFDWVRKWEDTIVGHRGDNYLEWKRKKAELLIDALEKVNPGIRRYIIDIDTSSPLTIRDYLGNKEGSLFGLHRDCNNLMQTYLTAHTKLGNLFLTGQDVNVFGLCGTSMSAIATAEMVLNAPDLRTRILQTVL